MREHRQDVKAAMMRSTQIAAKSVDSPAVGRQSVNKMLLSESDAESKRVLWIDGVGGFLLLDQQEVLIGQAIGGNATDISIVGDVSRQAAAIRRAGGDYLLQPLQPTLLDGRLVDRPQLLQDDSLIQLGERVQLRFRKPNPLSATARLELASVNKFKPNVDGILLLADSCVLGPTPGSHILCRSWQSELLMFRHGGDWYFRTLESVEVNGEVQQGQIALVPGMRMQGEDFSLSVE